MKIDSHHHLWQYSEQEYDWIDDSMSVLKADFVVKELETQLANSGIDGSVVVQARQSLQETYWLCELAEQTDKIKGIVGWVDLRSETLEADLIELKRFPKLKGFRHVLQGETDPDFMTSPKFINGLKLLEKHGYCYDLLIFSHQLPKAVEMLSHVSNLKVVIDHIAKPEIKSGDNFEQWQQGMAELAANPNIYCKVSGMVTEANWVNWQKSDFKPYLNSVHKLFGEDRLMFGSDWPVCLVAASYDQVKTIVEEFISSKNISKDKTLGTNATRFYQL